MEAFDLLQSTGVAYTIVDEPLLPPDLHVTSPTAYLRWHGHGSDPWYNYHYSEDELMSWVPRVQQVASQSQTVFGFFNRSEEHTSELQSPDHLVCRLLLEKK